MPSGAKKRKAAKKKLQKKCNNHNHNNVTHSQGNDDLKPRDDRESAKETSSVEVNVVEISSQVKTSSSEEDKSSSSNSSSSEDDEVKVEKESSGQGSLPEPDLSNENPVEDTIKDVPTVVETAPFDNSTTSELVELRVEENMNEMLPSSDPVGITRRDMEDGGSDQIHESEEQPLVSSTPMPVRRTSWMSCCGLVDVFSGGSSR